MLFDFTGKTALVTGAAQGMGKATALAMAGYGANVVCIDIKADAVATTAKEINEKNGVGRAISIAVDVCDKDAVYASVDKAIDEFKKIDFLLNCAGMVNAGKIVDLDDGVWERVMKVNGFSVYHYSKAVGKHMIENGIKGKIASISSQAAKLGEYGNGAYSCSKAVVSTLTQVLGLEMAEYGINVNAICPGPVKTQVMEDVFKDRCGLVGMTAEEYEKDWIKNVPLNRMATPEEMAEILTFLCSDYSSYMTGVSITVAGGMTII